MAQSTTAARPARPQLVAPRQAQALELVRQVAGDSGFDIDAWHVMEERDNQLIADEILHGAGSSTFVYNFDIQGKQVAGISVIGARHLAAHYKSLKHRLVAGMQKVGSLFVFTSYPAENMPMQVSCSIVAELAEEEDFYQAVVEMADIKTGNSIQVKRREARYEERRGGGWFERPNYATIAQSKAYRNAVLALVPQDLVIRWREDMLKLKKTETITASVLDEKRQNVIRFAAQKALPLDRHAIEALTLDQIAGLGDAAREGRVPQFVEAARALGLEVGQAEAVAAETGEPAKPAGGSEQQQQSSPARSAPVQTPADRPREDAGRTSPEGGQTPRRRGRINFES